MYVRDEFTNHRRWGLRGEREGVWVLVLESCALNVATRAWSYARCISLITIGSLGEKNIRVEMRDTPSPLLKTGKFARDDGNLLAS